jgi:hypothetical protein
MRTSYNITTSIKKEAGAFFGKSPFFAVLPIGASYQQKISKR